MNSKLLRVLLCVTFLQMASYGCDVNGIDKTAGEQTRKKPSEEGVAKKLNKKELGLDEELRQLSMNLPTLEELGYQPAREGINTGTVIVCGRLIPPPYNVQFNDDSAVVILNGIELCPGHRTMKLCWDRVHSDQTKKVESIKKWIAQMKETDAFKQKCIKEKRVINEGKEFYEKALEASGLTKDITAGKPVDWNQIYKVAEDTKRYLEKKWPAITVEYLEYNRGGIIFVAFPNDELPLCLYSNHIDNYYTRFSKGAGDASKSMGSEQTSQEIKLTDKQITQIHKGGDPIRCPLAYDAIKTSLEGDNMIFSSGKYQFRSFERFSKENILDALNNNKSPGRITDAITAIGKKHKHSIDREEAKLLMLSLMK